LTLIQTKRIRSFPVILMGSEYWGGLISWLKDTMLGNGMISPEDMDLFSVIDDPQAIVRHIRKYVIL